MEVVHDAGEHQQLPGVSAHLAPLRWRGDQAWAEGKIARIWDSFGSGGSRSPTSSYCADSTSGPSRRKDAVPAPWGRFSRTLRW